MWDYDPPSRPLLALLCAISRNALLRATAKPIIETPAGAAVNADMLSGADLVAAGGGVPGLVRPPV